MNTILRHVIYGAISCSLFCTVIMTQQKVLSTELDYKTNSPQFRQIINASPHSAPVAATAVQQILNVRSSNSVTDTSPASNSTASSVGSWLDSMVTKVNDNIWGHETMVLEDIKKNKIAADTDGLHRIDRAIDACIKDNNYKVLDDLIEACSVHKITINPSHIGKAEAYFAQVEKHCKVRRQGLNRLKQETIKILSDVTTVDSEPDSEDELQQT